MPSIQRFNPKLKVDPAQTNLIRQHPAEAAAWVWQSRWDPGKPTVVEFTRTLRLDRSRQVKFHLSADQRFQLRINGELVARGPDRSDVSHWAVASYRGKLPSGKVTFSVLVWWLPGSMAPLAQMSHRPGFLFAAEGSFHPLLSTGVADWKVCDRTKGIQCKKSTIKGFQVIGPSFAFDLSRWTSSTPSEKATVVRGPVNREFWGVRSNTWCLYPSLLPEQRNKLHRSGRIRAMRSTVSGKPFRESVPEPLQPLSRDLNALIHEEKTATIPASTSLEILWDLDDYLCGYPHLEVSGGEDARIRFEWAESLFETETADAVTESSSKGDRDTIDGKSYSGFGDEWKLNGSRGELPALWWRSGRYVRLLIRTREHPLKLHRMAIRTTGYPFRFSGKFESDHKGLRDIWPILKGGIEHCAHEQWVDCPYYEQLSYVGDNNTELSAYCLTRDEKLSPRCLELFDWSRHDNGLVAERYPSFSRQDSFTYALLYPRLVKDYAFWRDDPEFLKRRLPGLRALIETCLAQVESDGLLHVVPGWPFIDWVKSWDEGHRSGCPASAWEGDSSLVNLHLYFALVDYAATEDGYGDSALAQRAREKADELGKRIRSKYWNAERSLLADDSSGKQFSEHSQAWAILSGLLSKAEERKCLSAWENEGDELAPMSIYFAHYAFEAYYRLKADRPFFKRLQFWEGLSQYGLRTTPERPEPSRSDCHGWGAHPIYHAFASIAGIRPSSAGFRSVVISPMPGTLNFLNVRLPHPQGEIRFHWKRTDHTETATITLPKGLTGEYRHADHSHPLKSGEQRIAIPIP